MVWLMGEVRRLRNTARWSYEGWVAAWAREKSLRQWAAVNALSVALSLLVPISAGERALIYALWILLLAAELLNTAIEKVVDYISTDFDARAKRAKDAGSAVVALVAIAGAVAWAVILIGRCAPLPFCSADWASACVTSSAAVKYQHTCKTQR